MRAGGAPCFTRHTDPLAFGIADQHGMIYKTLMSDPNSGPTSDITPELLQSASLDDLVAFARDRYPVKFETVAVAEHRFELIQLTDLGAYVDQLAAATPEKDTISLPFWAQIWPANVILALHMDRMRPTGDARLLEIGAGGGLAGMVAAARGFQVTLSDVDGNALLFARINTLKNNLADRTTVRRVDFTADRLKERYDIIVGCEVLYRDDVYRPLAKFLVRTLAPSPESQIILARSYKRKATRFFNIADADFQISEKVVGCKSCDESESAPGDDETAKGAQAEAVERHLIAVSRLVPRKAARNATTATTATTGIDTTTGTGKKASSRKTAARKRKTGRR